MEVHFGTGLLRPEWNQIVACIGSFDGVHLGHQRVIECAIEVGRSAEAPVAVVTFDRHPAAVLNPDRCPPAIASLSANLERFESLGVGIVIVLPFNAWLSRMSAERFLREMLIGAVKADRIVVGHDFAMGNGREGNTTWLSARIPTTVVEAFSIDGVRVSSSGIRQAVAEGDIGLANRLLGRTFRVEGVVVHGQKLGRTLGFPTANVARSFAQVVPADGVYAAFAETRFGGFQAAVAIGTRPAVGGGDRTIEAFLIDYPGDSLYGHPIRLDLVKRLRPEASFPSLDALVVQMRRDVEDARAILSKSV